MQVETLRLQDQPRSLSRGASGDTSRIQDQPVYVKISNVMVILNSGFEGVFDYQLSEYCELNFGVYVLQE